MQVLGNKERFEKEQIGIKEPFPVTNLPFTSEEYGTFDIKEQFKGDKKVPYWQVRLFMDCPLTSYSPLNSAPFRKKILVTLKKEPKIKTGGLIKL